MEELLWGFAEQHQQHYGAVLGLLVHRGSTRLSMGRSPACKLPLQPVGFWLSALLSSGHRAAERTGKSHGDLMGPPSDADLV